MDFLRPDLESAANESTIHSHSHYPSPTQFLRRFHHWRMLLQHLLEIPARVGRGMGSHLLWRSRDHDLAAPVAAFWTEIDDPVRAADHIEVVLNYHKTSQWA